MASNYTENYGLSQWEATDQVLRTEFNEDNAKADAALTSLRQKTKNLESAISGFGNCQIVYGSYTGSGLYGRDNPTTLSFEYKPILIVVHAKSQSTSTNQRMILLRGAPWGFSSASNSNSYCYVTWKDNSVSWFNESHQDFQFSNRSLYYYAAFLQVI